MVTSVHPHDALFRLMFSDVENAAGLFAHLLPAALGQEVDWTTLRLESGAYVNKETLEARQSDLLFSAQLRSDPSCTIYLNAEHQSDQRDGWNIPFRLLRYQMDHWSRLPAKEGNEGDDAPEESRRPKHLPAVFSLVVFHGAHRWRAPTNFAAHLHLPPHVREMALGLLPDFQVVLDDLTQVPDAELRARPMPPHGRMTLWYLKYSRLGHALLELLGEWKGVHEELMRRPNGEEAERTLWLYYQDVSEVPPEKVRKAVAAAWGPKAEEIVMTTAEMLRNEGEERGLTKGLAKGEAAGKAKAVLAVLGARDLPVSDALQERILGCQDLDLLDQWVVRAATAKSAAEVVGE